MSSLQAPNGIEVTVRGGLDDGDAITCAVVVDEPELRFTRAPDETQESFQTRVRSAAAGRNICWGLPDMPWE
jgi:hypothetical protein